jgi:hypothetical protein
LKAAEEDENQEVKVYHLNDKDEEWEKIEEIKDVVVEEVVINEEKSEEEWIMVIDADKFSIYIISNISIQWVWDTITITYNANWWEFDGWDNTKDIVYNYTEPTEWTKYSHTPTISDDEIIQIIILKQK